MIKNSLYFAACLLLLCSCASRKDNHSFVLNGKLEGISKGSVKLVRMDMSDRTRHTVDSATIEGGQFTMQGEISRAEQLTLSIEPGNWSFRLFVEPGEITVEADTTGATHYDYSAYGGDVGAIIEKYTVSGSANQDIMNAHENHPDKKRFMQQLKAVNIAYQSATGEDQKDSVRAEAEVIQKELNDWTLAWIDSLVNVQPTMSAGALLLENYYQFNQSMPMEELEKRVSAFKAPADSSGYIVRLKEAIGKLEALMPGKVAPDFTLLTPDSAKFTLSSTRGKYVLIDFWASWCAPCRQAIPHWKEVYAKYHDKGFEIVALTNDSRWTDWFKALKAEQMPWPQVADEFPIKNMPARVAELYMVPSLPTYVLLDKEGRIILHTTSKAKVDEELSKLFL